MIYYIYKVRRKQTSIRFSRFTLPHRYLRYISWISWEGISPLQAGFFHPCSAHVPQPARAIFAAVPIPQGRDSCAPISNFHLEDKANIPPIFPPKKHFSSLFRAPLRVAPSALLCPQLFARVARGPSAAGPSPAVHVAFCGPPINKKMRAHGITPRTRKSVDFSLKKTHVGTPGLHAFASAARTYSLTARTALFPFSFFTKEKKKENRSKFSRFEYIARTHFVRPHDVRDWPVAPRPLKFM